MDPGRCDVKIRLVLPIAQPARVVELVLPAVGIRVVRNLVVVGSCLWPYTHLIRGVAIIDERCKAPITVYRIMYRLLGWRLQSIVAAIAVCAHVPGEFLRMIAKAQLVIGLVEISECQHKCAVAIALKPGARNNVEYAVGAISKVGPVAAA